jgi:hypothetical protein
LRWPFSAAACALEAAARWSPFASCTAQVWYMGNEGVATGWKIEEILNCNHFHLYFSSSYYYFKGFLKVYLIVVKIEHAPIPFAFYLSA